ncbi:hypothetical protein M2480_002405 [Parabacteroides sp. PFB2-12]|uniref:tubulin-like doman-containing protein n=1 Tax=unclassified Parabacteroides TaxID=2649774 RepID=UPI002476A29E|nr:MULTISPECIES: tubulin-like doman-containing protein [unclassified Parabacteroides]MDH6343609.1 hypothetical protein [Parabacteroides sp. PM6-13]MDH6391410.1 hypothetical protein [Parabacteroides sp. PFB2-12]
MKLNENHILIGVGGTGGKILKAFRKRIFQEYNESERKQLPVGYVYVDSSREMMTPGSPDWRVLGQDACFLEEEFVFVKGVTPAAVLQNPEGYPGLKGFTKGAFVSKALGEVGAAAAQKRLAGRILFGSSINNYKATLLKQFTKINHNSGAVRTNIHIFAGLAGGTGSGAIIDLVAQTRLIDQFRKELDPDGKTGTNIVVYCMVPEVTPPGNCDAGNYHANGYAALTELNALLTKRYKPYDVSGKSERLDFDALDVKRIADGCIVYSNVNEHGRIVDSFTQLPSIVADFTYNRIFLPQNDNTEEFIRAYSFENINDWRIEYHEKEKDPQGKPLPARTKTFSSFGIKRIVIPEEEIVEYFTYSFGKQALLQMRYNNWNDDLGFRDRPANKDFRSEIEELLEKWRMTRKHITLDSPILEDEKGKWGGFADYWNNVIPVWTEEARGNSTPINELERFCNEGYDKFFRKRGVAKFFEDKIQSRELHANEISGLIEAYMFNQWMVGDLSLYNLLELMEIVIETTEKKRNDAEGEIRKYNQQLEQLENARKSNALEYGGKGVIGGLLFKNKLIQNHSTILQQLYLKKTEREGLLFAISMLSTLQMKLNSLKSRVEKFVGIITTALDDVENQLATRCQDEGGITDLKETVIRFYDQKAVHKFTQEVIKNTTKQKEIAREFRQQLGQLIGQDHTFARANATVNRDEIAKLFDTAIRAKAITIHDTTLLEDNEKLINRNILEQLSEEYPTEDSLRTFATEVVQQSGVYTTFSRNEINKAVPNNVDVPEQGQNIMRKIVFVNLPEPKGNEQIQRFAEKLQAALTGAVEGGIKVCVDMSSERKNEITISTISYCFPLRVLDTLTFLREKYEYLTQKSNEASLNRIVLHTEDISDKLPALFVQDALSPEKRIERYSPYLILAYVTGVIRYADRADGTGKKAYGEIEKNRLGMEILKPLSDNRFTDMIYGEFFTEAYGDGLKEKFEQAMRGEYLHVEKRQELVAKVQELVVNTILPECGNNQGSEQFLFWSRAAETALDNIEQL